MDNEDVDIDPDRHIDEARQLAANGSLERAFESYLLHFSKAPETKGELEKEFELMLKKMNDILFTSDKLPDIFFNLEKALKIYPRSHYLYNELGKHLYMCKLYIEACIQFQKALKLDCRYVAAEINLNSVKNLLVERWHFRMLNDKVRNDAYYKALREVVKTEDFILDIGTGTGLLSLYAQENKPLGIAACDASEDMIYLAENIMIENEIDGINLIHKMSTDLTPQEINGKRSLIITELFDAGLFGENILQTLEHAWENLLLSDGRVLPAWAEFFIIGAQSQHLHDRYHLTDHAKHTLGISHMQVFISGTEPYDCEDVHFIKDIKYITEAKSLLKIDFNSIEDIKSKLYSTGSIDGTLKGLCDSEVNVVIGWFNLYLTDEINITTSPMDKNRANAWQQAIFYDFLPKKIVKGGDLPLQFTVTGGKISLYSKIHAPLLHISSEILRFLNDREWIKMIADCIQSAWIYLGQIAEMYKMEFVDLSPFPLFGFYMMKREANSLVCHASSVEDKEFIMKVFRIHQIPLSKVTILVGDELQPEVFNDMKFHALFYNILTLSGDYNPIHKELMETLISDHLHVRGLILPHKIYLINQLVASQWLNINNRVYDSNLNKYIISSEMNRLQVSQNLYLDLSSIPYTPMTHPSRLTALNKTMKTEFLKRTILKDGGVDACLCWYKIQLMKNGRKISTNRENSFIDSMAYLADPTVPVNTREKTTIIFCVDENGPFKILITPLD